VADQEERPRENALAVGESKHIPGSRGASKRVFHSLVGSLDRSAVEIGWEW